MADCLLSLRADLMARNSYDCDAGHFAGLGGSIDACKFLREKGRWESFQDLSIYFCGHVAAAETVRTWWHRH